MSNFEKGREVDKMVRKVNDCIAIVSLNAHLMTANKDELPDEMQENITSMLDAGDELDNISTWLMENANILCNAPIEIIKLPGSCRNCRFSRTVMDGYECLHVDILDGIKGDVAQFLPPDGFCCSYHEERVVI